MTIFRNRKRTIICFLLHQIRLKSFRKKFEFSLFGLFIEWFEFFQLLMKEFMCIWLTSSVRLSPKLQPTNRDRSFLFMNDGKKTFMKKLRQEKNFYRIHFIVIWKIWVPTPNRSVVVSVWWEKIEEQLTFTFFPFFRLWYKVLSCLTEWMLPTIHFYVQLH